MAMILTCYYRPKPGGLCTRLFRAIEALLDRGHVVHYLAVEKFPVDHPLCIFHRFPWPARHADSILFWAVFHLLAPVWLLCLAIRYHVTHAFAFGPTYAFLLQPVRIFGRAVVTCFLRGDTISSHRLQRKPAWIILIDQWIEGLALKGTRVVGVSRFLLDAVLVRHPVQKDSDCLILPNDLPPPVIKSPPGFTAPLNLATAGILEPVKNQIHVIHVLRHLTHIPWHLCFYGPGPEMPRLKRAVMFYGLEDRVSFMAWTSRQTIWSQTSLLLSSSIAEGMPNAVLEAVANGVPVLASDIPAHREILPPAQLIPLNDPEAWQSAFKRIFENPSARLSSMVRNQHRYAAHLKFDWDERIVQIITGQT